VPALGNVALWGARSLIKGAGLQQQRGLLWSVEREKGHTYKDSDEIVNHKSITEALEKSQAASKDPAAIRSILEAAKERSFLTNFTPGETHRQTVP
jgi:hypothetical protein